MKAGLVAANALLLIIFTINIIALPSLGSPEIEELVGENCISSIRNDERQIVIDDFGVPVTDYGYMQGEYVGPERYAITIANVALYHYAIATNGSGETDFRSMRYYDAIPSFPGKDSLYMFMANANWLRDNMNSYGNYSVYDNLFPVPYPPYTIHSPWRSAMAQGLALDVLTKAYNLTGDMGFLNSSNQLVNAFYVDAEDGGITLKSNNPQDGWWYELYANDQGIQTRVLNAHMFALLGLHSYYEATGDSSAKFLFDKGLVALKQALPKYDYNGEYSFYDLSEKLSPLHYHRVVVQQLLQLLEITNDEIIKNYHDRWVNFTLPQTIFESLTCRRTPPPDLTFRPADSNLRIGNIGPASDLPVYSISQHDQSGANFTSQILNFRAHNISLRLLDERPDQKPEMIISINVEGINEREYLLRLIPDSKNEDEGWSQDHRVYTVKDKEGQTIVLNPGEIIGDDYLRIRDVNLYIPNGTQSSSSFLVRLF